MQNSNVLVAAFVLVLVVFLGFLMHGYSRSRNRGRQEAVPAAESAAASRPVESAPSRPAAGR